MRFMVIVKASKESEAGVLPSPKLLSDMNKFNQELLKAGVLLAAGEGLHPSATGARVKFSGDKRIVTDGPFAETKELIAGFWLWKVKSREEAIAWVKRCPNPHEGESEIEIRQVFELEDFPDVPAEVRETEEQFRKTGRSNIARRVEPEGSTILIAATLGVWRERTPSFEEGAQNMATKKNEKIGVENVNHPGHVTRVDADMYDAMKRAYLRVLPKTSPGLTLAEIRERLIAHLPEKLFPDGAKAGWWAKTVQLDLEAKGLAAREKTKPLRLRKQ